MRVDLNSATITRTPEFHSVLRKQSIAIVQFADDTEEVVERAWSVSGRIHAFLHKVNPFKIQVHMLPDTSYL